MNIKYDKKNTILTHVKCLNLPLTLDCGQAFRWKEIYDNVWHGVAMGLPLTIEQKGDTLTLYNTSKEDFLNHWKSYFDFERDYDNILSFLVADELLGETVKEYYGIRILVQDSWEALFSFVFSSSNNIKRIRGFIEKISKLYGEHLGNDDYAFPTAEVLSKVSREEFRALGAGYRDVFLEDCAKKVYSGEINLEEIKTMPLDEARKLLMTIAGVGPKVAECALLFGFNRLDAFPVDRWIKRVLDLYPNGLPECFNGYQGIAQQYMFHYARMNLGA